MRDRHPHGCAVIGQRIASYRITALVGEGAMGKVYAAQHVDIPALRVAIKCLRRLYADDDTAVARFFNEARAAMAVRHPSIVDVLDVGWSPDGMPYLVMELLAGETLARRLSRGRIPVSETVDLARQVTSALSAAHREGIVHRDLKPENLFLVAGDPGEAARVKILDFGVAKLRHDLPEGSGHTRTGSIIGTPAYMSPEQCRGLSREIDGRADIYSLGVILYEMLAGRPPFVGEAGGDTMIMQVRDEPPPVSSFVAGVPARLEGVIRRALAKSPADRFHRAEEMQAALAGNYRTELGWSAPVERTPVPATPSAPTVPSIAAPTGDGRRRPPRRRYRTAFVALGLAGLAAVTPLVVKGQRASRGRTASLPARVDAPPPRIAATAPPATDPPPVSEPALPDAKMEVDDSAAPPEQRPTRRAAPAPRPRRQMKPW
jgi:serine/threonine-protein kinase